MASATLCAKADISRKSSNCNFCNAYGKYFLYCLDIPPLHSMTDGQSYTPLTTLTWEILLPSSNFRKFKAYIEIAEMVN